MAQNLKNKTIFIYETWKVGKVKVILFFCFGSIFISICQYLANYEEIKNQRKQVKLAQNWKNKMTFIYETQKVGK